MGNSTYSSLIYQMYCKGIQLNMRFVKDSAIHSSLMEIVGSDIIRSDSYEDALKPFELLFVHALQHF